MELKRGIKSAPAKKLKRTQKMKNLLLSSVFLSLVLAFCVCPPTFILLRQYYEKQEFDLNQIWPQDPAGPFIDVFSKPDFAQYPMSHDIQGFV